MYTIDLNCDMGEGCANDAALMEFVSSVNIACGYHAGDEATMWQTVETAIEKGVSIGAHPGYSDRENFGRKPMMLPPDNVRAIVADQILALKAICEGRGTRLNHVKPHGALFNEAARNPELAAAIANAIFEIDPDLILYGLSGSHSITESEKLGLRTASEVFADRTYTPGGDLTPRSEANALITDPTIAAKQALSMITNGVVTATDGASVRVKADTICIHGDGEHALEFAKAICAALLTHHINIRAVNA